MTGSRGSGALPFQCSGSSAPSASMNSIQSPTVTGSRSISNAGQVHDMPRALVVVGEALAGAAHLERPAVHGHHVRPRRWAASGSSRGAGSTRGRRCTASAASSRCAAARAGSPARRASGRRRSRLEDRERALAHGRHVVAHLARPQVAERAAVAPAASRRRRTRAPGPAAAGRARRPRGRARGPRRRRCARGPRRAGTSAGCGRGRGPRRQVRDERQRPIAALLERLGSPPTPPRGAVWVGECTLPERLGERRSRVHPTPSDCPTRFEG